MAWKGVHITRPARISLTDGQLTVGQDDGEARISLEDIAFVVLDEPRVTLTGAAISACMESGVVLITTDARHTPSGLTLPFHRHHRQSGIAARQIEASAPLRKRLWQALVRAKIDNQAEHLSRRGSPAASALSAMAALVASGDPDNIEARAARDYWRALFSDFVRDDAGDLRNKALNYGYAVTRACVARAVVAYGLLPSIGVHHASQSNSFNLADDLFEPFRPSVDAAVAALSSGRPRTDELTREDRRTLAALPMGDAVIGTETMTLLAATEKTAESLARAFEAGDARSLVVPRYSTGPKPAPA
jgi:CRISPR-associated protein Cas1